MSTIPGLPEQFADLPSVQMVPPPSNLIGDVTRMVEDAAAQLRPGERGALIFIATTKGVNFAAVHRVNDKFTITGWFGKNYGQPVQAGIAGSLRW